MCKTLNIFRVAFLVLSSLDFSNQNILGGSPLYSPNDKIVLLNNTNFQSTICGSSTAWLVEFYSSWCGHCIHFAPTFKQLAEDVYSWRGVMAVAAIDCAMEYNMETCREYEVMGYPTIKFFSPNTPAGDMGQERQNRDKTIPVIKRDMITFLSDLQSSNNVSRIGPDWPKLPPVKVTGNSIPELWLHGAKYAILIFEDSASWVGREVILDLSEIIHQLKVPLVVSRVESNSDSKSLMETLQVEDSTLGSMVAVAQDMTVVDRFHGDTPDRKHWVAAVKKFIWDHSSEFSIHESDKIVQSKDSDSNVSASKKPDSMKQKTGTRKEVMNRRYKVHMSDLEKTIVYAISHEVAQHSSITSHTLTALQQFVTVLHKYFPARIEMSLLLRELKSWVHKHQVTEIISSKNLFQYYNKTKGL